ncbi:MAG: hypothetical protein AAF703_19545 [Cyanobacteria bacterium P01_D01_bin.105]
MARDVNADCKGCSAQSIKVARAKPCFDHDNPQSCYSARSYYKRQEVNKAKKRSKQRAERVALLQQEAQKAQGQNQGGSQEGSQGRKQQGPVEDMEILPVGYHDPPEVQLLFFQDRADGKRHALQFTAFDRGEKIDGVKAIHLKGMSQKALRRHINNVLGILSAKHGTEFAVSTARQATKFCPLCLEKRAKEQERAMEEGAMEQAMEEGAIAQRAELQENGDG